MHHSRENEQPRGIHELIKDLLSEKEKSVEAQKHMDEQARQMGLGATGEFPDGKLRPSDEGALRLAIGHEEGKVVINFGKAVAWIAFSPKDARALAEAIRKHSYIAEGK